MSAAVRRGRERRASFLPLIQGNWAKDYRPITLVLRSPRSGRLEGRQWEETFDSAPRSPFETPPPAAPQDEGRGFLSFTRMPWPPGRGACAASIDRIAPSAQTMSAESPVA
jgi:hypothetical protein